jgi:hypothetical protein
MRNTSTLPEEAKNIVDVIGERIGDVEKPETCRRSGKLAQTTACCFVPVCACSMAKPKSRTLERHDLFKRWKRF